MCSVPHSGKKWKTQDWSKSLGSFWVKNRTNTRIFLSYDNKNKGVVWGEET
ncbi:unnamed protein product, partial [Gulo gulo]